MYLKISTIEKIALRARKDFEKGNIDKNELRRLYLNYNPIKNINLFIKKAKKFFPKLNCGLASVYLKKLISDGKIIRGKYLNKNHTFLLLEDKIIVDITSDQYGGPKIYVGPIKYPYFL
jgi:hypothetical protein